MRARAGKAVQRKGKGEHSVWSVWLGKVMGSENAEGEREGGMNGDRDHWV